METDCKRKLSRITFILDIVNFSLTTSLWRYPTQAAAWYFVTIDATATAQIKSQPRPKKGWGSVRVQATIGHTTWDTSIFPSKEGVYLLPVKASVRKAEDLFEGESVTVLLKLV